MFDFFENRFPIKQSLSTDGRLIAGSPQNLQDPRRARKQIFRTLKIPNIRKFGFGERLEAL